VISNFSFGFSGGKPVRLSDFTRSYCLAEVAMDKYSVASEVLML
jgi:hypothetical protein